MYAAMLVRLELLVAVCLTVALPMVLSSPGDASFVNRKCVFNCNQLNCTADYINNFYEKQPIIERLLHWDCLDECKYTCMWVTVDAFQKDGLNVPQFHGKWPFIRIFGIQEPASMVFSVMNGLAHLSILRYRRLIPSATPMYYVWHAAALTAMNAWMWSTIFHSRDTDFTEKMDYFSAFSIVLFNTFTLTCRCLGTRNVKPLLFLGAGLTMFFIRHICYLSFNKFDYGYNMQVNIGVAVFNMVGWMAWCFKMKYRDKQTYIWKAVASIVAIQCLLSLELWDFPPIWWTFDAHSLWHGGTPPLCLLWYSFIIDDARYLMRTQSAPGLPQVDKKQD